MTSTPTTDSELVARCLEGDEAAWGEVVDRYARYVYAIAVRMHGLAAPDAEDVFQETFARAYERLGELRDPEALRGWLGQTARRLSVDRLRAAGREELVAEAPTDERLAADPLDRLDEALTVREALATLPEHCREVLDRFFCRDQSYRTIGAALDLPGGTIASRISRCLTKLREVLEGRDQPAPASSEVDQR